MEGVKATILFQDSKTCDCLHPERSALTMASVPPLRQKTTPQKQRKGGKGRVEGGWRELGLPSLPRFENL